MRACDSSGCLSLGKGDCISLQVMSSEKYGSSLKLNDNDLKSGRYRVLKLPQLSVKHVGSNSHKTNHPIIIPKIVLKSVL